MNHVPKEEQMHTDSLFPKGWLIPIVLSAILFLAAPIFFAAYLRSPFTAGIFLFLSATVIFAGLLQMRANRTTKGLLTIGFGALITTLHTVIFHDYPPSEVVANIFTVMKDFFQFSCAGAGGSILAVHGDKFSKDRGTESSGYTLTTDSLRIRDLEAQLKQQSSWLKLFCLLALAAFFAGLIR